LKKIGKALLFLFIILQTTLVAVDDLTFTARVNTQRIHLNNYLAYDVVISGKDLSGLPKLTLPDFQGKFDVVSSSKQTSYSFSNGSVNNSEIRKFSLLPVKTGDIIIGAASIKFKGKLYKTNTIKVTVIPPVNSSPVPSPKPAVKAITPPSTPKTQKRSTPKPKPVVKPTKQYSNIFADAQLDKREMFVGEQLTYSLKLFRRLRLFSDIAFEIPEFNGFWVEPLEINKSEMLDSSTGRRYHVRELEKKALFPLNPGTISIAKSRIGVVVNMFEGQKVLHSDALNVLVKPLPEEGKPDDFSGLVGEFQLHGSLSSRQVTENNSLTYTIILSGKGNLRSIENISYVADKNYKIYRAKVEDNLNNKLVVSGERTFSYIVIPKTSGEVSIPEFNLSYFSADDKQYKVITLKPIPIRVYPADKYSQIESESYLPSAQKLSVLNEDLQYLRTPLDLDEDYSPLKERFLFMLLLYLNGLAIVVLLLAILKKYYWKTDFKALRSKRAYDAAIVSVDALNKEDTGPYLSQSHTIILDFLSAKIGESLLGKTHSDIKTILIAASVSEPIVDQVITILEKLSFLAYAPDTEGRASLSQVESEMKSLFAELRESL
jgi:hypothetical protein